MDLRDSPASTGTPSVCEAIELPQQGQIMLQRLAETEAGIDHQPLAADAGCLCRRPFCACKKSLTSATTSA